MTETLTARDFLQRAIKTMNDRGKRYDSPDGERSRAPTPVGWSDTDWIKHIADQRKHEQEQPHPMSCLHINQGSLDAAADAYEAEYNKAHVVEGQRERA
jgi:hypothetical protein